MNTERFRPDNYQPRHAVEKRGFRDRLHGLKRKVGIAALLASTATVMGAGAKMEAQNYEPLLKQTGSHESFDSNYRTTRVQEAMDKATQLQQIESLQDQLFAAKAKEALNQATKALPDKVSELRELPKH